MKVFRVAILTAKQVEFDAVRKHLVDEQRIDDTFDGTVYRKAKIRRQIGNDLTLDNWEVAIYRTGRGQQPAAYGAQILLQHFRPDIVLFVGVAGGEPSDNELSIGDVVVGKVVRYYERTSQRTDDFIIKDEYHTPNRALLNAAEYEADDNKWRARASDQPPNSKVFIGEIASGEKVQKSSISPLWVAIKKRYSDIIAVETEGHGFHYALTQSHTRGLMVRSISDLLDNKDDDTGELGTDDHRQALASSHAAAFAINLIANLNTKFLEQIAETTSFKYAVILTISTNSLEGVQRATRLLADAINDPHLTVENLQPANSFILRISTTLYSAAFARALYQGGLISDFVAVEVTALVSDVQRTGEKIFDQFLEAVSTTDPAQLRAIKSTLLETYPAWSSPLMNVERLVLAKRGSAVEKPTSADEDNRDSVMRIKEMLDQTMMSRKELAARAHISYSTLSSILTFRRRPNYRTLKSLESVLQQTILRAQPFGETLKKLRRERNLSLKALAGELGISERTLIRFEQGSAQPTEKIRQQVQRLFQQEF